jgi:uncharacterized membrane protein YoaK (UPF0700 family)
MFSQEGTSRPPHHNWILAGYLSFVAGWVNAAGFLTIGTFTSHVTGNVGRLMDDLVQGRAAAGALAAAMVLAFFTGALLASMLLESNVLSRPRAYAALLAFEAALLVAFHILSTALASENPLMKDAQALLLCGAMGVQNSLVTRLSGAVVRTTHLTGVVTDLGIEAARWFRYFRVRASQLSPVRLTIGQVDSGRPSPAKTILLANILGAFASGSALSGWLLLAGVRAALFFPVGLLLAGAMVAFRGSVRIELETERK